MSIIFSQFLTQVVIQGKDFMLHNIKTCKKCQQNKPFEEFYKMKGGKFGLSANCKKCFYERNKPYRTKYLQQNRVKVNARARTYMLHYSRQQFKTNPNFKLKVLLRSRIYKVLKGINKSASTLKLLGCSVEQFKTHLSSKFQQRMTWANHGKWHIDHIRPCASFDLADPNQQKICFHYTNMQPLWAHDNLVKNARL